MMDERGAVEALFRGLREAHCQRWDSDKLGKFLQRSGARDYKNFQLWIVETKSQ